MAELKFKANVAHYIQKFTILGRMKEGKEGREIESEGGRKGERKQNNLGNSKAWQKQSLQLTATF